MYCNGMLPLSLQTRGREMKRRDHQLNHGDRVEVYRNLHKDCFSVRLLRPMYGRSSSRWGLKGTVTNYFEDCMTLYLRNVKFAVQPAGRDKVRREGKKNVHAFVRGIVLKWNNEYGETFKDECTQIAQYDPYKFDTFVTQAWSPNPCPIYKANKVTITEGKVYVN